MSLGVACPGPARAEDSISSGCAGGLTGGGYGVTVERGGRVYRWHAPSSHEEREEVEIRRDATLAATLFEQLERAGFEAMAYRESGNMTCSLTLRSGEQVHAVTWPHGDAAAPPEALRISKQILALLGTD